MFACAPLVVGGTGMAAGRISSVAGIGMVGTASIPAGAVVMGDTARDGVAAMLFSVGPTRNMVPVVGSVSCPDLHFESAREMAVADPEVVVGERAADAVNVDLGGCRLHAARLDFDIVRVAAFKGEADSAIAWARNKLPRHVPAPVAGAGEVDVAEFALGALVGHKGVECALNRVGAGPVAGAGDLEAGATGAPVLDVVHGHGGEASVVGRDRVA